MTHNQRDVSVTSHGSQAEVGRTQRDPQQSAVTGPDEVIEQHTLIATWLADMSEGDGGEGASSHTGHS